MTPAQRAVAPQVLALLQQGLASERSGAGDAFARAAAAYQQALALWPENPDALQLLGLLAKRGGDGAMAEALLRRSLAAQPAQPHVWNNLGNLLDDLQRPQEAHACFEQATRRKPDYAEAHYNDARVLRQLGQGDAALAAIEQVLQNAAAGPALAAGALQLRALIAGDGGQLDAALAALDRALQLAPQRAALHHNRAVLLQRQQRSAEALAAHEQAQALGLVDADAHYNRGNSLQALGRLPEALAAYRAALALQPLHTLALYDLARLRWRIGDADFDAELRSALRHDPHAAQPALVQGQLLWRAGRFEAAAAAFAEALQRQPGAEAHDGLGRCLVRLGRHDEGLAHHGHAVDLTPNDAALRANQAASLLVAGRADAAAQAARAALALAPYDQYALALLGLSWRAQGDDRESRLHGGQRFVLALDIDPPAGWPGIDDFLAALAGELDAMHHDRRAPIDQTLRHGTQTFGDILELPLPAIQALRGSLARAIDTYLAQLPDDGDHPFLVRRGQGWRFADSWSARLGASGHHVDHVHPHGWLSAAFYVQVPERCGDPMAREGWLRFGVPESDLAVAPGLDQPSLLEVQPRPGRLVLFPSLMWHGTRPFGGEGPRTTVSFDVVPTREPGRSHHAWMGFDHDDK